MLSFGVSSNLFWILWNTTKWDDEMHKIQNKDWTKYDFKDKSINKLFY
jgi:hypothetical protein